MTNKEIKLMIIENYIDWFTSDEDEREEMKISAAGYVEEDHVDELEGYVYAPKGIVLAVDKDYNKRIDLDNLNLDDFMDKYLQGIIKRRQEGLDCTEGESAEIKGYIKETFLVVEDGSIEIDEMLQELFPQEWSEAQDELENI